MREEEKRGPTGSEEMFAWGFLVGYMGEVPDEMADMDELWHDNPSTLPVWLTGEDAHNYRRGYDAGCTTYADHVEGNDE